MHINKNFFVWCSGNTGGGGGFSNGGGGGGFSGGGCRPPSDNQILNGPHGRYFPSWVNGCRGFSGQVGGKCLTSKAEQRSSHVMANYVCSVFLRVPSSTAAASA